MQETMNQENKKYQSDLLSVNEQALLNFIYSMSRLTTIISTFYHFYLIRDVFRVIYLDTRSIYAAYTIIVSIYFL